MKSLERRFSNISQFNPVWSSYICFVEAVKDQNFSKRIVNYYFNKLVEKDDYAIAEKREIVEYLNMLSTNPLKVAEEGMF